MRIVTTRRISQVFFLLLFVWFCVVTAVGENWWEKRGWEVNWFVQLDPLVALATVLTTGALFAGLVWALATVVLTIVLGRFFCGWICPFGAIHQFVGWLGNRKKKLAERIQLNKYRPAQKIKYYILIFLLVSAAGNLISRLILSPSHEPILFLLAGGVLIVALLTAWKTFPSPRKAAVVLLLTLAIWISLSLVLPQSTTFASSLQTGLLDPIPLMHRSLNLALLPLLDSAVESLSPVQRHYELALLIGAVFLTAIFLNLWIPRFYCRFICPLGALLGLLGRHAIWRIGKTKSDCPQCRLCDRDCEGGCNPSEQIHTGECVLCMNCYNQCTHDIIHYQTRKSAAGEIASADISRRGFILSVLSGLAAPSLMRISGITGANWNPAVIRPPGALIEQEFLARCVKCGQCMKICPTNVLQPASLQAGIEGLWTPVLNNRIGTSGCQLNCTACSTVCPTSAIRRITLDEKLGRGEHTRNGPIKLGTAFVDRSRCLPWAMETPCIVCQENCPLSPKAIHLREEYVTVRGGRVSVRSVDGPHIEVEGEPLIDGKYATGDYYIRFSQAAPDSRHRIVQNTSHDITLAKEISSEATPNAGSTVQIQVRLQRPHVDPRACIGCGVCEHECPVAGKRAIRVSAENESRSRDRRMLLN